MKKWIAGLIILMLAVPAMAQFAGLPIAGGAAASDAGQIGVSAGGVFGDDFKLYGIRGSYAVIQGLDVFLGLGAIDPDEGADTGITGQLGAEFTLPTDLPVDLAVRGTIARASFDLDVGGDVTALTLNGGMLVSKTIEQLTPYGFVGFNYTDTEVKVDGFGSVSDDETDFAIAIGLEFAVSDQVSLYAEIENVDDTFFALGGRWQF